MLVAAPQFFLFCYAFLIMFFWYLLRSWCPHSSLLGVLVFRKYPFFQTHLSFQSHVSNLTTCEEEISPDGTERTCSLWHIYDDSSVCCHTQSLMKYYILSHFTNVTIFCLTFHYRSALTIFFDWCFTHCCQTLSLWVFSVIRRVSVTLRLFPSGLLNIRNVYFFFSYCSGEKMTAQCQCLVISAGPQCNTESTDRTGRNVEEPCGMFRYLLFQIFLWIRMKKIFPWNEGFESKTLL